METIKNEFDNSQNDKALAKVYENEVLEYQLPIEDLTATDLEKVEKAIRIFSSATEVSNLAMALSVRHIVVSGLYKDVAPTHTEYFAMAEDRLRMDKQKVSRFLNIGIAYFEHRKTLDSAGFKPEGDFSKLKWLQRAIDRHGELKSVKALCNMSRREFEEFAKGPAPKRLNYTKVDLNVRSDEKGIFVEDKNVITVKAVEEIVAAGSEPFLVGIDSPGEKTAIKRFLKDFRSKK